MPSTIKIRTDLDSNLMLNPETISLAKGVLSVSGSGGGRYSINAKDLEKVEIEEGVGIGRFITVQKDKKETEIAYFTKRKVKMFRKFADAVNKYIKDGRLVSSSFEEHKKKQGGISTLWWLIGFTKKHRRLLAIGVALSFLAVLLNLIPPYLLKVLIDNVILSSSHPANLFEELTIILIASYAASAVISAIQSYTLNISGNKIVTELRGLLFKHAVRLPATDVDSITVGRIQSRLISDTGNTQWLMTYGLSTVLTNALTIIGIGIILFLLFPALAIYVLIPIPFIIVLIISYNKRADRAYHKSWRSSADLITKINDVVPNYTIVKSATKESFESDQFDSDLDKYYDAQADIVRMETKYWQPVGFLVALATVVIWWVGGNQVILGNLQLGVITAFLAYMGMFYGPIQQLSSIMPWIQECLTSGERLREAFDSPTIGSEPKGTGKGDLTKDIRFEDVWFGYDPLFPVIKGINATIKSGEVTAVVGKSGSGKSTMAKLMLGLYKTDSGSIRFGGMPIDKTDIVHLRERIAYVPQESSFFDNTIAYNLEYFSRNQIPHPDMIATTKAVEMHAEIMKLPLCYDNRIRGRGLSLSGGQRQRLAIARALLGSPDIVLMDEITSNLDAVNSRKVNKAVLSLESSKTMVFITHDLNEIMNSDSAIVMDDGKIAEHGRPSDLIKRKGRLYDMFKYKIGKISKPTIKKHTLHSFVADYIVNASGVDVRQGERRSFVEVTRNGKRFKRVVPVRPFPVSNPNFIIFYGSKGGGRKDELFAIEDSNKLAEQSRAAVTAALDVNSFNPVVRSIEAIKITGDGLEWKLKTDNGTMKFMTKNRSDIVWRGSNLILIDEFNTPLNIDSKKLDQKSAELLRMSI